jgi:preprotein translocase subunit SecG
MLSIILIIGFIAAVLVIGIVWIQNPKGGGLASNFSSGTKVFGAQRASEGVEKLTWIFAAIILVVSLAASSYNGVSTTKGKTESKDSKFNELIEAKPSKSSTVAPPAATPAPSPDPTRPDPAPQQTP